MKKYLNGFKNLLIFVGILAIFLFVGSIVALGLAWISDVSGLDSFVTQESGKGLFIVGLAFILGVMLGGSGDIK